MKFNFTKNAKVYFWNSHINKAISFAFSNVRFLSLFETDKLSSLFERLEKGVEESTFGPNHVT